MAYAIPPCLRLKNFKHSSHHNTAKLYSPIRLTSPTRVSLYQSSRYYAGGISGPTLGQLESQGKDAEDRMQNESKFNRSSWSPTLFKMLESAATTFASILVLGLAGYGYHRVRGSESKDVSVSDQFSICNPWSSNKTLLMPLRAVGLSDLGDHTLTLKMVVVL